jgi:PAS domain S-box-containing protein
MALLEQASVVSPELDGPIEGDGAWFPAAGGEMGARIRCFDWSSTPLGPTSAWPTSLRQAVSICLRSRFQLAIYWGPQLILLYNDAERDVLGALHPQVLGRPAAEVLADMWDVVGPMLQGVLDGGEATWSVDQALLLNRRGLVEESFFTYSYSPIPDGDGVGGVLLVTVETTERVLAERRLRTLRELATETAKAQSPEDACDRAAAVLGGNRSDLPFGLLYLTRPDGGMRLCASTGLETDPDPDGWPLREAARSQQAVHVEDVAARLPHGKTAWPRAALVLPIAQAGQGAAVGCLVAGLSDFRALDEAYRGFLELVAAQLATAIEGARALEEGRRRAEALAALDAAKTTFFTNVSHEFRTPLTLLLGPVEEILSRAGNGLSPADRERLAVAHQNGLRLLKLVNMLLEFARIEGGRVQAVRAPTDLAAFTAELASMFRSPVEQAGLRLCVDCPPLPRPALVDRDMWEKIVLNLLSNAFKFTHAGEIVVALRVAGPDVELSVRDTGAGIPEEELPRLFERFHQIRGVRGRTHEGTGIGLALVQELVKLHGGSIHVESTYGRGSTFVVSVPMGEGAGGADQAAAPNQASAQPYVAEASRWVPDPVPAEKEPVKGNPPPAAKARVLVVDDNDDMRQYLSRLLEEAYEVEQACCGETALAAARERPQDLVLADVMMPDVDGFDLVRKLRADPRTRTVPVILLSARAGEESRVEGLAAGADDYLVKPFSARELQARVGTHLELAQVRREAATILDSISDGFIALDREWRFTYVNSAAERINGMPREDLLGKSQWDVFPYTRGTELEREWRRAAAERVPVQFEFYYAPWNAWFQNKAYPTKDGGISVYFHDVTAHKQSEEVLRKTQEELEGRVRERTQELSRANACLEQQIAKRKRVEEARARLLYRLVRAQEEERRRIARELHDDLTQRLAVLAIEAGKLEQAPGSPDEARRKARDMREQLVALSEGVHSLSRQLHPSILDDLGLVDALRAECLGMGQRDGIAVQFGTHGVPNDLSREVVLCVYRVAQEALRNVARHAQTRRASVRLWANDRELLLQVRDRGVGFDVAARGKTGLGLSSMRERVRLVRARLTVRTRPGEGTRVTVRVPLSRSSP